MRVAILNCSDIAKRRIIPAFQKVEGMDIIIVCSRDKSKAKEYAKEFDIPMYTDDPKEILQFKPDVIYISSPPSEHFESVKFFLENGVNVLCEKSFTTDTYMTNYLIDLADRKGLIIQENYGFEFHSQWKWITENLNRIGRMQCIRASFEFPPRDSKTDFRYNSKLGGGALFDAGGYPIKLASLLLTNTHSSHSVSSWSDKFGVDLSGRCSLVDTNGVSAFLSWSFESPYRCDLEITGSKGVIRSNKIFTPKVDEAVEVSLTIDGKTETNHFSCDHFAELIKDMKERIENKDNSHHKKILEQSKLQSYVSSTSFRALID